MQLVPAWRRLYVHESDRVNHSIVDGGVWACRVPRTQSFRALSPASTANTLAPPFADAVAMNSRPAAFITCAKQTRARHTQGVSE